MRPQHIPHSHHADRARNGLTADMDRNRDRNGFLHDPSQTPECIVAMIRRNCSDLHIEHKQRNTCLFEFLGKASVIYMEGGMA